jgi:hypothetical protein
MPMPAGGGSGRRPLGEGAEAGGGGGCCSGGRSEGMAALTVPLAPAPAHKRASFDQELTLGVSPKGNPAGGAVGARERDGTVAAAGSGEPPSWLAAVAAPGGPLDGGLIARDVARALMTFVTTALSYALMLAAMSFHVAIFFAVCAGVAVGAGLFGRFRPRGIAPQHDVCCG